MNHKKLFRLILWEFEETWRLPTPELITGIAIFFGLTTTLGMALTPLVDMKLIIRQVFLFQMFIIAVLFARSIAANIEKREILIFFTYPVKRTSVLHAKFLTNLSLTFIIFASVIIARALLSLTEPWNTTVLIALFTLFIQTLFLSTFSLTLSLITKRTWAVILIVIISFFAIVSALTQLEPPLKYLFPTYGTDVIMDFLAGRPADYTLEDFTVALGFPIITSIIFLIASYIYFKRMQVD